MATVLIVVALGFTATQVLAYPPPGVDDVFITSAAYSYVDTYNTTNPFPLNVGTTKTIYVNGRVTTSTAGTGFADGTLQSVELRMYRANVGSSCTIDLNDCYKVSCTVTANSQITLNYSCTLDLSYISDSTMTGGTHEAEVWNAEVIATDDQNQVGSRIQTFEIPTSLSVGIPTSVAFGVLAREQATTVANNVNYPLTQNGNDVASVTVSATNMTCTPTGTIQASLMSWSLTDVDAGDPTTVPLAGVPANVNLGLGTDDDVGLVKYLYFNITLPSVVSGTCSGFMTVEAIAG